MMNKPTVSFIIPTLNEERNIERCLESIAAQTFEHSEIEVLIADALSTDATVNLVKIWSEQTNIFCRIIPNKKKIAEFGKAEALRQSRGRYLVLLDADNEIVQKDWLNKSLKTFDYFPDIFGVESNYLKIPGGNAVNNFLTAILHINDPLAWEIASKPTLEAEEKHEHLIYRRFHLPPGYPCGANGFIFARDKIDSFLAEDTFEEGQVTLRLALEGNARFAMINGYGVRHYYTDSLSGYCRKRTKIALKHTTRKEERETWVDYAGKNIYLAALKHLTLVFPLVYSIKQAVARKEPLWLLHAPMCWSTSVLYLVSFLKIRIRHKRAW